VTTRNTWAQVELARHPERPYMLDYVSAIFDGFVELHGDRLFGDDRAVVGGPALLDGETVMIIGQQKGRNTSERAMRNFGMAHPEGYRKALRLLRQAEKFGFAVVSFVDTPAAFPGAGAEERGISWAIAQNLMEMARLATPIVAVVIGEGGSGGALGIGVGDRLLMLTNTIYSVAPPETCASILWRDISHKVEAAAALKLTAGDLDQLGLVDEVIPEPPEGAHTAFEQTARALGAALRRQLADLKRIPLPQLLEERYQKYRHVGAYEE
jgi:acetyl-CoA carboxylase carboxyl transferase subunit alpha